MIAQSLRVAFFPDAYHEIDGVANTSRHFEAFALRHDLPFLTVHGGATNESRRLGSVLRMCRRRGRFGFPLDKKHDFDLAFWRHMREVEKAIREFNPDVIHITGPSDVGQLGLAIAHNLRIPLVASWHTNVHQYAEQRVAALLSIVPARIRAKMSAAIREGSLWATMRFYHAAQLLFAPNRELIELMERRTGKPCHLMDRGVDTELFHPKRRTRTRTDGEFVIGYVGRLTVEKNIRFLADLERSLIAGGLTNFRFVIVGQGAEEEWLRANMLRAELPGVLKGEALAEAYANMDVFAFPSRTDTYGNVVLEALASGVPAIVTNSGGPQFIVRPGKTGFVARDLAEFSASVRMLAEQPKQLEQMRAAARLQAEAASWDAVFESVYAAYERIPRMPVTSGKKIRMRPHTVLP